MGSIIAIVSVVLVVGAVLGYYLLRNVQPDELEVEAHLVDLKKMVENFKGGFVPFDEGISRSEMDQILEKNSSRTGSGVFLSTNGDPIFAYAFRKYIGPNENWVLYVLTLNHEYVFRTTTAGTRVTVDGERKGFIQGGKTYVDKMGQEVAEIKRSGANAVNKILIDGKEVAKVALPEAISVGDALEIQQPEMKEEEKELVQTIAMFDLVYNAGKLNQ
ncbi:MAG: hypothetical protein MK212_01875 [Saprospiraceae bacterium]|nr:hypothetical protein [Saprospiraceae bacterium]